MILRLVIFLYLNIITGALGKYARIIGGRNALIQDYPFMARFMTIDYEIQFCNGVIITKRHILTAAHCFDDREYSKSKVCTGSSLKSSSSPCFRIKELEFHPEYTGILAIRNCLYNDIAVATLYGCMPFNSFQNKVRLPIRNTLTDTRGLILGWGKTSYPGSFPEILQVASTTIISNEHCNRMIPHSVKNNQICAFERQGIGICVGDSGGPLLNEDGELIGIASFCTLCAIGDPDIYTRVYYHLEFIMSTFNDLDLEIC